MLYTVSIPIADKRVFLSGKTYRLDPQQFPQSWSARYFLRSFGQYGYRSHPEEIIPFREKQYANAHRGICFVEDQRVLSYYGTEFLFECVFRRAFFDDYSARIDIGIKDPQDRWETLYSRGIFKKVNAILRCRVSTRGKSKGTRTFLTVGQELAQLLLYATTKEPGTNWGAVQRNWMIDGCPVVVVECGKDELEKGRMVHTKGLHPVFEIPEKWGVELYHKKLYQSRINREVPVWIIVKQEKVRKDMIRALRIFVLKTHQERETLKAVMRLVHEAGENDNLIDCGKMSAYLNVVTSTFSKERRDGVPQKPIMDIMRAADSEMFGNEAEDMMRYLERNVELWHLRRRFEAVTKNIYNVNITDNHGTINIGALDMDAILQALKQVYELADQKDKLMVKEKIEQIKEELESKEPPKKSVLKGIVSGLKVMKGSAEFVIALNTLAEMLGIL